MITSEVVEDQCDIRAGGEVAQGDVGGICVVGLREGAGGVIVLRRVKLL